MATFNGTNGNDVLPRAGQDNGGNDFFFPKLGQDDVDGGDGFDTLTVDYSSVTTAVNLSVGGSRFDEVFTGRVTTDNHSVDFDYIESLIVKTGSGDDTFAVIDSEAFFLGSTVDFNAGGGTDTLRLDVSQLIDDSTFLVSTAVTSTLGKFAGFELYNLRMGVGNDKVTTGGGADVIDAGAGDDTINSGSGNDTVLGGSGNNIINTGSGDDTIRVLINRSTDTIDGGSGLDTLLLDTTGETGDYSILAAGAVLADLSGNRVVNVERTVFNDNSASRQVNVTDYKGTVVFRDASVSDSDAIVVDYTARTTNGSASLTETGASGSDLSGLVKYPGATVGTEDTAEWTKVESVTLRMGSGRDAVDFADNVASNARHISVDGGGGIDTLTLQLREQSVGATVNTRGIALTGVHGTFTGFENFKIWTGAGTDRVTTGNGNDEIWDRGPSSSDQGGGNDTFDAGAGNDELQGGRGNDLLIGGDGTDLARYSAARSNYIFVNLGGGNVRITDKRIGAFDGVDEVRGVENFKFADGTVTFAQLFGPVSTTINGTSGNDEITPAGVFSVVGTVKTPIPGQPLPTTLGDTLNGLAGNDLLDGGAGGDDMRGGIGNDTYIVENTGDKTVEALDQGTDTAQASLDWTLSDNVENLILTGAALNGTGNALNNVITGNAGNNVLKGEAGNDTLDGGLGADTMEGGVGDDAYLVDRATDIVTEAAGAGNDSVQSSVSLSLAKNVEDLTLTGAATIGKGNSLNNKIIGNGLANTLEGKTGLDTLTGGLGADKFVFGAAATTGADTITDFVRGLDKLVFKGTDYGLVAGALNAADLRLASSATTGSSQFYFNKTDAGLYWDADGLAGGGIKVATLTGLTTLAVTDFLIA